MGQCRVFRKGGWVHDPEDKGGAWSQGSPGWWGLRLLPAPVWGRHASESGGTKAIAQSYPTSAVLCSLLGLEMVPDNDFIFL